MTTTNLKSSQPRQRKLTQDRSQPVQDYFGDILVTKPAQTFRFGFQNINKLPAQRNAIRSKEAIQHLADGQYDIFMLSEVGLFHPKLQPENQWSERVIGVLNDSKAWFAYNNREPAVTEVHQYGGVGIVTLDEASHRILRSSKDPKGLGRWISVTLQGKEGHLVTFFSVYRPVENHQGSNSVYQQHLRHLKVNEEPRQALLDDLKEAVTEVMDAGHHIVIGIDANEDLSSTSSVTKCMRSLGLKEAIQAHHHDKSPPETYRRNASNYPIDGIFASSSITVTNAGYLPYDEGIPSDHRGLWIDVSFSVAFGHRCPPLFTGSPRRLKTKDPRLVQKYIRRLKKVFRWFHLPQKLRQIQREAINTGWSQELEKEFNQVHSKSVEVRMDVEKSIRKLPMGNKPWSPRLQKFRDTIALWEMMVRRRKRMKVSMTRIRRYAKKLGLLPSLSADLQDSVSHRNTAYKEYKAACSLAENWRSEYQESLLDALAEKNQSSRATELKTMIRHERQRRQSRSIKLARNKLGFGKVTKVYYETPDDTLVKCDTKATMDEAIITENRSRFSQSEHTPPMRSPLIDDMGYYGEKFGLQEVLRGAYQVPSGVSQYTKEFLHALQQPEVIRKAGCASSTISREEHQAGWRKQKEGTSSEPTGPSFSHYMAAAQDPMLSDFDRTIRGLPYHYGFSPLAWRHITDVSILKKAGVYVVEKMRTIQLMFAEFNMNNKKIGRDVMAMAEALGLLPDDQYGSRKTFRAIMAALNKRLTMDILRQRHQAGALCANDAKSCYDRIVHWVAIAALCRAGLAFAPALSMFLTLGMAVHFVSTAYGISARFYGKDRLIPLQGAGQGNGSGPAIWAVISAVLITMMYSAGHGVHFLSPISMTMSSFVCYAFVDDTDLVQAGVTVDSTGEQVVKDMQQAVDRWEGGLRASGGALVPGKSHWYLVDFVWRNLRWEYRQIPEMEGSLSVVDTCGTKRVTLKRHPVEHAEETLGVKLAMDGNNRDQVAHLLQKTSEFADHIRVSTLSNSDVWFALERCLMMTLEYCLPAVTLSAEEWKVVMAPIMRHVLPKAGVDRSFPRKLLFAPKSYQGLGLMHPWHRQCLTHVVTLLAESLKASLTSKLIIQTLEGTRLEAGLSQYFWDRPFQHLRSMITPCWLSNIWSYASKHHISIRDPQPVLSAYWSQDVFLMDVFSEVFTGEQLRCLNECRMFLRVTVLSEVCTTDGTAISYNAWHGFPSCNRWNQYEWPRRQKHLPSTWWSLWQKALVHLFCNKARTLKKSLGYPLCLPHRWRWYYSAAEDRIYHREGGFWRGYSKIAMTRSTRFQLKPRYSRCLNLSQPPNDLRPVTVFKLLTKDIVRMDGKVLPAVGLNVAPIADKSHLSEMLVQDWDIVSGSLEAIASAIKKGRCLVVSDGSFKEGHCTAAFTLRCLDSAAQVTGVNALPGPVELSDSFRGELSGVVGALEMVRWISHSHCVSSGSIELACDGKSAIRQAASSTARLQPNQPSFDLLQKIRDQLRSMPVRVSWKWVRGHQSGRSRSLTSRLNTLCDKTAKAYWKYVQKDIGWQHSSSFSEGWQVWLGKDKLTSVTVESLYEWAILFDPDLSPQDYWEGKHQVPHELFHEIDWDTIGRANRSQPAGQQRWLSKFLSGFLGTNQREQFRGSTDDPSCPRCDHPVEDGRHVLLCQGAGAQGVWRAGMSVLEAQLTSMETAQELQTVLVSRLNSWYFGIQYEVFRPASRLVRKALVGQDCLGWNNFMYGRTHRLWALAQLQHYESIGSSKSPRRWLQAILKKLWSTAWDMWQHRNQIKHVLMSGKTSPALLQLRSRLFKLSLMADSDWLEPEKRILAFTEAQVAQWTEVELKARILSIESIKRRVRARVKLLAHQALPQQEFMANWLQFGSGINSR